MKVQRTHKIRLNLTEEQHAFFWQSSSASRFAYNWALEQCNIATDNKEKLPSFFTLKKQFNAWKKEQQASGEMLWYKGYSAWLIEFKPAP